MPQGCSHLERFMRAVHRQHVIARWVEHAGWGLVAGGGAAVIVLAIAWFFARPALAAVSVTILLGLAGGVATGWWRRPSALDSAMEADRQLNLADLLSTAWLPGQSLNDPWLQTVIHVADVRCQNLKPSQVLLARWGGRAWGSVALAIALLLTAAVMVQRSAPTWAANQPVEIFSPSEVAPVAPATSSSVPLTSRPAKPVGQNGWTDDSDARTDTTTWGTDSTTDNAAKSAANHDPRLTSGTGGVGTGMSQTHAAPQALSLTHSDTQSPPATDVGLPLAGTGGRVSPAKAPSGQPSAGSSTPRSHPAAPPWSAPLDSSGRPVRLDQIESQPAYQPYRDLIRAYFDRE